MYETAWRQQGTESSKALGQVRGTTRKPFPQKGRGKARAGTLRAAHFVGGYAVHGPRPGMHLPDMQQKAYDAAIRTALMTKLAQNQLIVVDDLSLDSDAKQSLRDRLEAIGVLGSKSYLMHGPLKTQPLLVRAADKFAPRKGDVEKRVLVTSADLISVVPVLENEFLVVDKAAIEWLEERYLVQ
ncbi:54S ribosomal protein L4 mitochondrial [Podochytrium sp. JEL0797]|nr:54S ribosomal protein L4 mitochondrial [Podochytrium sp. JEL0797]